MGQSTSEIIEEEVFQIHLYAQNCRILGARSAQERRELEYKAKNFVLKNETGRARGLLVAAAIKGNDAEKWESRAFQLDNIKHRVLTAGIEADVTKTLVILSRAIGRALPDPVKLDRELASLDDNLSALGAGGREFMDENQGETINVEGALRKLQDEAAVMHDLPFMASNLHVMGNTTPLRSSGIR